MTAHIAFFSFPAYAHVAPTLPVVEALAARGHRVTYVVADRFADLVEGAGARALRYDSTFPWQTGIPADSVGQVITFLTESFAPLPAAVAGFAADRPDLLVHDQAATEGVRVLARAWGLPSVQSCPTFASNQSFSLHEAQQAHQEPGEGGAWDQAALDNFFAQKEKELDALGLSDMDIVGFGGDNGPNLVYVPREFQVKGETFGPAHSFVGPTLAADGDDADWTPPAPGTPVVLISLGTSPSPGRAEFFSRCAKAFAGTSWHVVMTLGSSLHPDELGPLPPNVEARQWVQHPAVLKHASVFVTHSGMGSVMEALAIGVPMVCVPHHVEQKVIADRVAELNLGVVVDRHHTDAADLVAHIDRVAGEDRFRAATKAMSGHVADAGGAARAANVIESLLDNDEES